MSPLYRILAQLAVLDLARAADIFVSPSGTDNGAGTEQDPFQTLHRAQLAVQEINQAMNTDINVIVTPGTYYLPEPLNFTATDSGSNGHRVIWQAQNESEAVNISGGTEVSEWSLFDAERSIYSASVTPGTESRHFFANQKHAQRAQTALNRTWLANFTDGFWIVDERAEFLLDLPGLEDTEIRAEGSFTTRVSPIQRAADNKTILMEQPAWANNIIGYDTLPRPDVDHGFFVVNNLAFLDEENEWFLDSQNGTLYYKPPAGVDINTMYLVLPQHEQMLVLSGTYDEPVHDLSFVGFNYMHTTWLKPSTKTGYVDQQTGSYIGLDIEYTVFESSRPYWWQIPGSIQASAVRDVAFSQGSLQAVMGGFGIGNDANAHTSGVGLGASVVEITGMYLTQTGTNAITIGGVQADAHHPSDVRMLNQNNKISENIFTDVAVTYSSGVPILVTYTSGTEITNNDVFNVPYSGICYGFGWGSNDAGGSDEYERRGLYQYQPRYTDPTIMRDGVLARNSVHNFGLSHSDLGGIYTLSRSPNTTLTENWISNSPRGAAFYHDEGSRDYVDTNCVVATNSSWLARNEHPLYTTGNLTIHGVATTSDPGDSTNEWGDTLYNITRWSSYSDLTPEQLSWVCNAGIPAAQRDSRPESYNDRPC